MAHMSHKEIREELGHCPHECRVVIHRDGRVSRFGSPDIFDRSMDYWQDMGRVEDYRK